MSMNYLPSPQLLKGALISVGSPPNPPTMSVVEFQFNPDTLRRSLQPQMVGGEQGVRSQLVRYSAAPVETIDVEIELDAGAGDPQPNASPGIYPQLASLELFVYPDITQVQTNQILLNTGVIEIVPYSAPRVLFVWGPSRVLPVRINSFSITEQAFHRDLYPIRATVAINMRVLTYSDLSSSMKGYQQYVGHQKELIRMAAQSSGSVTDTGVNPAQLM